MEAGTKYLAGLSPLARGTLFYMNRTVAQARFIPAGAGNTHNDTAPVSTGAVYPRWRGEHVFQEYYQDNGVGLSPLARGTLISPSSICWQIRFIPAGAGNTGDDQCGQCHGSVYPRWRGEHHSPGLRQAQPVGLSPLARGTPGGTRKPGVYARFIPAGAGNTRTHAQRPTLRPVYPRWRGEHGGKKDAVELLGGLSPLARGTRCGSGCRRCRYRFIPAGAGNTPGSIPTRRRPAVYPRWRGEHPILTGRETPATGLSPLARGTPQPVPVVSADLRFIPAGAGNTPLPLDY